MTKPTRPRAGNSEPRVVEIDAIDVAEWERDQHTPQAPPAGLAALVRQTAAPPVAEPRTRHPTAVQGSRRRPPKPPPSSSQAPLTRAPSPAPSSAANAAAAPTAVDKRRSAAPPVAMDSVPLPLAALSTVPIAYPARAPFPVDDRDAAPAPARVDAVPLPLIAPPSAPTSASQAIAPMHAGSRDGLRVVPEHTPAPPAPLPSAPDSSVLDSRTLDPRARNARVLDSRVIDASGAPGSSELDGGSPPPSLTSSLGSLRMVIIVGAAITVVLAIIAILAFGRSQPASRPASARPPAVPAATSASRAETRGAATSPPAKTRPAASAPAASAPAVATRTSPPSPAQASPARTGQALASPARTGQAPAAPARTGKPAAAPARTERGSTSSRSEPAHRAHTSRPERIATSQGSTPRATPSRATAKRAVRRPAKPVVDAETAAALTSDEEPAVAQARAAYATGNESLFAGDFTAAIDSYRQAIDRAPSYAAGYRGLGLAYAVQGDSAPALKALRTYLGLAPHAKDVALIKRRIAGLQSGPH